MSATIHISQELREIVPADFSDQSRVWIFQSNRPFSEQEMLEINEQLNNFYVQWKSHGQDVKGWAQLLFQQFVVVMADEDVNAVGGCSTDGMVRVIKSFERQYQVNFFDRLNITFLVEGKAEQLPMQQVKYALEKGFIETDTPLFNNLVDTKFKLMHEWLIPLSQSWLWQKIVQS
jgi:hypothetical protein